MKKIIDFVIIYIDSIILSVFIIYMVIFYLCELSKISVIYNYIAFLLLGMVIGSNLYQKKCTK